MIFNASKSKRWKAFTKGKNGTNVVFAPMLKHLLESMLEAELDNHMQASKASGESSRKNRKTRKTVRSLQSGHFELESTRDRNGTFEPKIVPKRQLIITEELEDNVIAIYARDMSTRNISDYVKEMYAMEISAPGISSITDRIIPAMNEWKNRPLEAVYPFVFLDCMHYKVRENGGVASRAVYNILGINREGKKDLIGIYLSENEGAKSGSLCLPIFGNVA